MTRLWLVSLRELQSATGEELRPFFGRTLLPSVLDRATRRLPEDIAYYEKVVVSLCEGWVLPPLSFGHLPSRSIPEAKRRWANTTTGIQDAHSTVSSSDFGETTLWAFSVHWVFVQLAITGAKSLPILERLEGSWRGWVLNSARGDPLGGGSGCGD